MQSRHTPKWSGMHRRWGRPFGELSPFHSAVAIFLAVLVLALFLYVLGMGLFH